MKLTKNPQDQYITKKYLDKTIVKLQENIDKKFAESYNVMDKKFAESHELINKKFDSIQKVLDFRLEPIEKAHIDDEKFKARVLDQLDWLVGAFKKFEEEHSILGGKYSDIHDTVDDHEKRLGRIESAGNFQ